MSSSQQGEVPENAHGSGPQAAVAALLTASLLFCLGLLSSIMSRIEGEGLELSSG